MRFRYTPRNSLFEFYLLERYSNTQGLDVVIAGVVDVVKEHIDLDVR